MSYNRGNSRRPDAYSPEQVRTILEKIGVEVDSETTHDFLCYCPFHGNRHTPSFSVSRTNGFYLCYNAACSESGALLNLVQQIGKLQPFPAKRLIMSAEREQGSIAKRLESKLVKTPEFELWRPGKEKVDGSKVVARMKEEFWETPEAIDYMKDRGFEEDTLATFEVGYSRVKDLLAVPMHDPRGRFPVGVVGRSLVDKRFKNSVGLPTSKTLWNFHRARRHGETVIITEASFDAMRVHQAGFPYVVAALGGNFSPHHVDLLDRSFNKVIIMTDFDRTDKHTYPGCRKCAKKGLQFCVGHNPGRDLGVLVAERLSGKSVQWASYEPGLVYPHGGKDAGDLTDEEIRQCVRNAVPNLEYARWGLY